MIEPRLIKKKKRRKSRAIKPGNRLKAEELCLCRHRSSAPEQLQTAQPWTSETPTTIDEFHGNARYGDKNGKFDHLLTLKGQG